MRRLPRQSFVARGESREYCQADQEKRECPAPSLTEFQIDRIPPQPVGPDHLVSCIPDFHRISDYRLDKGATDGDNFTTFVAERTPSFFPLIFCERKTYGRECFT
jgi:hypothetical protein